MPARRIGIVTSSWAQFIVLISLSACGGCWERIEYTGPDPSQVRGAKPARDSIAGTSAAPPMAHDAADTSVVQPVAEPPATEGSITQNDPTSAAIRDSVGDTVASSGEPVVSENPPISEPPLATPPGASISSEVVGSRYEAPSEPEPQSPQAPETAVAQPSKSTVDPDASAKSRRAAWELGSKLSIVALAHDRGLTADYVTAWAKEASAAAKLLGVKLSKLPDPSKAKDEDEVVSPQVLSYLFQQGQSLGRTLKERYGPDHAALFEVAVKSNLLLLLYEPSSQTAESISAALSQAAPRAQLPTESWQPLLDRLKENGPVADVRLAVRRMHSDVEQFLTKSVEQAR